MNGLAGMAVVGGGNTEDAYDLAVVFADQLQLLVMPDAHQRLYNKLNEIKGGKRGAGRGRGREGAREG